MLTSKHGWLRVHRDTPSSPGKFTNGLLLLNVCHHLVIALGTELGGLLQGWLGWPASVCMCPESWLWRNEQPKIFPLIIPAASLPFSLGGGSLIIYHRSWYVMIIIPLRCSSGKAEKTESETLCTAKLIKNMYFLLLSTSLIISKVLHSSLDSLSSFQWCSNTWGETLGKCCSGQAELNRISTNIPNKPKSPFIWPNSNCSKMPSGDTVSCKH